MRTAWALLWLAAAAAGEDGPSPAPMAPMTPMTPMTPMGDSLEAIGVVVQKEAIRADSARGVAESYAAYLVAQREVSLRFGALFRKAHLAVLERYYATDPVASQRAAYATVKPPEMTCRVDRVEGNEALLSRGWGDERHTMKLVLAEQDGRFRIAKILHKRGEQFVDAGLGIPPAPTEVHVPRPARPDRSSPDRAIRSLRGEMLRLRALRERGVQRLAAASAKILGPLLGDAAVTRAQARPPERPLAKTFHVSLPSDPIDGRVRMGVVVTEPVPGVEGQHTAVGHAGFDLRQGDDRMWRVTAELTRNTPDAPLRRLDAYFALVFLK